MISTGSTAAVSASQRSPMSPKRGRPFLGSAMRDAGASVAMAVWISELQASGLKDSTGVPGRGGSASPTRLVPSASGADLCDHLLVMGDDRLRKRREPEIGAEALAVGDRVGEEGLHGGGLAARLGHDRVRVGGQRVGVGGRGR